MVNCCSKAIAITNWCESLSPHRRLIIRGIFKRWCGSYHLSFIMPQQWPTKCIQWLVIAYSRAQLPDSESWIISLSNMAFLKVISKAYSSVQFFLHIYLHLSNYSQFFSILSPYVYIHLFTHLEWKWTKYSLQLPRNFMSSSWGSVASLRPGAIWAAHRSTLAATMGSSDMGGAVLIVRVIVDPYIIRWTARNHPYHFMVKHERRLGVHGFDLLFSPNIGLAMVNGGDSQGVPCVWMQHDATTKACPAPTSRAAHGTADPGRPNRREWWFGGWPLSSMISCFQKPLLLLARLGKCKEWYEKNIHKAWSVDMLHLHLNRTSFEQKIPASPSSAYNSFSQENCLAACQSRQQVQRMTSSHRAPHGTMII